MRELFTLLELADRARAPVEDVLRVLELAERLEMAFVHHGALLSSVLVNGVQQKADAWKVPGGIRGPADWQVFSDAVAATARLRGFLSVGGPWHGSGLQKPTHRSTADWHRKYVGE